MRKFFAVLCTAVVALCCTADVNGQSAPRFKVTKGDKPHVFRPVANASGLTVADLPATNPNAVIDPALISPTGVRGATAESGVLPSRGATAATAASPFGPPCQVTCVGTAEAEACGSDTNGGCTLDFCQTPGFEAINSGDTVCGTVFADMGARDLDYYELPVPAGPSTLTVTFESEFEGQVFIVEAGAAGVECTLSVVLDTDFSSNCTPVTLQRAIGAQQYYVAVSTGNAAGPIFDGVTCAGGNNEYSLSVSILGADCLTCVGTPEVDACGADTNIGCNAAMAPFPLSGPVAVGGAPTSLCGTASNDGVAMTRDTDWWEVTLPPGPQDVTITFSSEFAGALFFLNDQLADCTALVQVGQAFSGGCISETITVQADGSAGRFIIFVSTGDELGPIFTGAACGSANDYQIDISAAPQTCPASCGPVCGAGATQEGEPCPAVPSAADDFNGGCNSTVGVQAFSSIAVGTEICGTAWADSGTRDTDWYKFTVFGGQTVDLTINSTLPLDYFVVNETDGFGGALANPCDLANVGIDVVGNHPGDCVPITETGISLTVDPGIGQRDYVVFVGPADAAGTLFSGFPCVCDFEYTIELTTSGMAACNFPTGMLDSDCATGDVTIDLVAASDYTAAGLTVDIEGFGLAAGFTQQITIPGPFTMGDPIVQTVSLGAGVYNFDISGECTAGDDFAAVATVGHHPYNGETDLIFTGEGAGCIDSAAALEAALLANSRTVVVIDNLFTLVDAYDCLGSAETIWMALGTFPNNAPMLASEGTALLNAVLTTDQSVYVEGGDVWGTDAATDFFEVDGVEGTVLDGTVIGDGDDTLVSLTGAVAPDLDTTGLGAAYNQDNLNALQFAGDDFTDQLLPSAGTDQPAGSTHTVIFTETTGLYGVAVASEGPDDLTGRVISSSFEFGGYAGSQDGLMAAYLGYLKDAGPPMDVFVRGNCNNDASFNIADAVFLLSVAFPPPGMAPPVPACLDACDGNDDGTINIADAVFLLSVAFPPPGMMPSFPAPGPLCGVDPTADMLDCAGYDAMNCP